MGLNAQQLRAIVFAAMVLLGGIATGALVVFAVSHLNNTVEVTPPVTVHAPSGPAVTINEAADVNMTDMFPSSDTVRLWTSEGNITATGSDFANVTVDNINGTWTNTSSIDVIGKTLTLNPGDKEEVTLGGDITSFEWRQGMALDDGTTDFTYTSSIGSGSVTLTGLPANTEIGAVDTSTNTVLDVASSDGSGEVTFSGLDSGSHDVHLQTSANGPTVSNRDPGDGEGVNSLTFTLSADVSDPDFPTDNVTVEWYVDNSLEATEHIQSNQTVSHQTTINTGGTHTWRMELEDEYGNTLVTPQFDVLAPTNFSIRKELAPDELVDNVQVNLTAYYGDEVQRLDTTNGNVSLEGFPIDEPIIVRANASGYYTRTAVIESVFEQNSMYLLNRSTPSYLVRFNLEDPTGNYPREDTVLFVERDLNESGSVEWRVIAGDNFGVQGLPTNLEQDERYRLRIKNLETGATAVIGAYTAIQSETVTISPGSATVELPSSEQEYGWSFTENETVPKITFEYLDEAGETEEIKLTIHGRYNTSDVLIDNQTFTNTNDLTYDVPMTNDQANKTWTAELYIDRGDGFMHFRVPISGGGVSLLPVGLDRVWASAIGVFILLVVAMAFSTLNQGVGAITTSLVGGALWWFGVFSGAATGAAVVIALVISIAFHYQSGGTY